MGMIIAAAAVAGTVSSFTDWLFMGKMFHGAYSRYPEVWRSSARDGNDRGAIVKSLLSGYVMTAGVVALCVLGQVHSVGDGLLLAAIAWAGPLVVMVNNGWFIKLDGRVTFAHCLGYLARMALAGAAAGFALGAR